MTKLSIFLIAALFPFAVFSETRQAERDCINKRINLRPESVSILERQSFEGIPRSAFSLGLYAEHCLTDKKRALVWYYISACFGNDIAKNKLKKNLPVLESGQSDYSQIFSSFKNEIQILKARNDTLSNLILYHCRLLENDTAGAERHKAAILWKASPRLFKDIRTMAENLSSTQVPLARMDRDVYWRYNDELSLFEDLAILGNKECARALVEHYMSMPDFYIPKKREASFWLYVLSMLEGEASDAETVLKQFPKEKLNEHTTHLQTRYLRFMHSVSGGDLEAALKMRAWLLSKNADKLLLEFDGAKSISIMESGEFLNLVESALAGNAEAAKLVMLFYMYESETTKNLPFLPTLWIHFASVLGDETALRLLKEDKRNSLEFALKKYADKISRLGGPTEAKILLYNFHTFHGNKEEAAEYLRRLKKQDIDQRLLKIYTLKDGKLTASD